VATKVRGVEELKRNCRHLPAASKAVLREARVAGAEVIAERVRQLAPVDSGVLHDSIKVVVAGETVSVIIDREDYPGGVPYFAYVEYGTSRMDARPYFRPAFDQSKAAAEAVIVALAGAGLATVATSALSVRVREK